MRKTFLSIFVLLVCVVSVQAQSLRYQYSQGTAPFTQLTGSTPFVLTGSLDEGYSAPVPIGFSFTYAGVAYDSFQVSTNGFIRLGSGLASATAANALGGTLRRIIAPLWDDLSVADSASLSYQLSGTAPNRVLTVEWKNVKWLFSASSANAEFQVKLYEGTNRIDFHYGTFGAVLATVTASIGLSDHTTVSSTDLATGTFLSYQFAGDAGSRTVMATMGLEFKTVFLAPDNNTLITMTAPGAPMSGTYTVGGASPDFATPSQAAIALNARGVSGPVTVNIRPGSYEDVLHLTIIPNASATNTITVKNESGVVTLSPKNGGRTGSTLTGADAIVRLDGARFVTLDGLTIVDNPANSTTALKYEMGIVLGNSIAAGVVTSSAKFNIIRNISIDMNATTGAANNNAIGIRFGTAGLAADSSLTNSYNTIQDITIVDYWRAAVFAYGFSGTLPDYGNKITAVTGRNYFGTVNISSGTALDVRTVELNAQFDFTMEKTDIKDILVASNFTTNGVYGVRANPANGTDHNGGTLIFRDIVVENLELTNTSVTSGMAVGIEVNRMAPNTQLLIHNCRISDLFSNGTTGRAEGILVQGNPQTGFTATANVFNNLIYDIRAIRSTTAPSVRGMDFQSSAGNLVANVYFNTILLDNSVPNTAGTHQSAGIYWANYGTSTLDLRNNVIVNTMVSGTRAACLYASANSNLLRLAPTSNNNAYYAGTPSATALIAYDGATGYQTLATYRAAVVSGGLGGPREALSVSENVPFVSAVSPYNLNIQTTVPTRLESGGQKITGITTDFAGTVRNANFPDIGAYEFNGIGIDENPPLITYTPLANTHFTTSRQITATIVDPSGVATGANQPRIYYQKTINDVFAFAPPTNVNGSEYTFTINYAQLTGGSVNVGDTIYYYIAAQDVPGNAGTNPAGGSGANPPGTTRPAAPRSYLIIGAPLSGIHYIGSATYEKVTGNKVTAVIEERPATESDIDITVHSEAGLKDKEGNPIESGIASSTTRQAEILFSNGARHYGPLVARGDELQAAKAQGIIPENIEAVYPTIAAAIADLNLRGVSGHTTFLFSDTAYTTPTVQLLIGADSLPSADRTITFKPWMDRNVVITANSTSPVFIIANSYVTIDGSNTVNGTTRNLSIVNTNTGASAGVAFFSGSNYSTVKNVIGMSGATTAGYGIVFDNSSFGQILNNELKRTTLGIQLQGNCSNSLIEGNYVGSDVASDKVQNLGISILSSNTFLVNKNSIIGLSRPSTSSVAGMLVGITTGGANVHTGQFSNNIIRDVKHTGVGTSAYAGYGIRLSGNINNSNILVFNNVISDIRGDGDAGLSFNPVGIYINQGGGYYIYNNSVNLFGTLGYAGASAAASSALMVQAAAVVNLDIRNNILSNSQVFPGALGKSYAVYSLTGASAFTDVNYNLYNSTGSQAGFGFLGTTEYPNLAAWKVATGKDASSLSGDPAFTDSVNLMPVVSNPNVWNLNGNGFPLASVTTDVLGTSRSTTVATGPTDIGAYEVTPTVNPAPATADGAPALGGTQNFTFAGRQVGSITWGGTGTVPTSVNVQYYSGTTPPGLVEALTLGTSYWKVEATGGTGYSYAVTFNYDENALGSLNESDMNLAKRDAGVWNGFISSSVNTTANTVTATGLNSFSEFALFKVNIAAPTQLSASSSQIKKVNLAWTDNANDESSYIVERKLGDSLSVNSYSVLATLPANATAYLDTNVVDTTKYTYRVKAQNSFGVSSYSNQSTVSTIIPVELVSFAASVHKESVTLSWATATEMNNKGFDVERNINGVWEKIGFVEGKGTSATQSAYTFSDMMKYQSVKGGISYRLKQIDFDGTYDYSPVVNAEVDFTPKEYALYQNYPNPFNPSTTVKFALPFDSKVTVQIFAITGELVETLFDGVLGVGYHDVNWNGVRAASGMYIYRINAQSLNSDAKFSSVKKMMLAK